MNLFSALKWSWVFYIFYTVSVEGRRGSDDTRLMDEEYFSKQLENYYNTDPLAPSTSEQMMMEEYGEGICDAFDLPEDAWAVDDAYSGSAQDCKQGCLENSTCFYATYGDFGMQGACYLFFGEIFDCLIYKPDTIGNHGTYVTFKKVPEIPLLED